jgi:hypothetical protein
MLAICFDYQPAPMTRTTTKDEDDDEGRGRFERRTTLDRLYFRFFIETMASEDNRDAPVVSALRFLDIHRKALRYPTCRLWPWTERFMAPYFPEV